ncbi:MAG: hypothetical protein LBV50_12660 [Novosphingobium sp.]|nr:hypothetical protein [Novosphingobium sp.]
MDRAHVGHRDGVDARDLARPLRMRGGFFHRRDQVRCLRLGIGQQQIERAIGAVVEIDHPRAAALAAARACPAQLPDAARAGDHVAGLRVVGDEIDQCGPFVPAPELLGRACEGQRPGNGDRAGLHRIHMRH